MPSCVCATVLCTVLHQLEVILRISIGLADRSSQEDKKKGSLDMRENTVLFYSH